MRSPGLPDHPPQCAPGVFARCGISEKANKGFQSVQVINEDSGYYAAISVDDPQRVSRVGAGEDSVHEYLTGGRGVRFTRPKRDKKHPGSYVMFFVWLVLYCLILGTGLTRRRGACTQKNRRVVRC